jgi:acetylornithine aminotransferase
MAAPLVKACGENGLLVITAGKGDVLRLVPPLVVTKEQIDKAVEIICEQALKVMV